MGKFGVPYLTFPFNLLAIVTFLSLQTIYPAVPTEDKTNLSYNCSLLETQFKVNKKMNEKLSINTQAFDVIPFSSGYKLLNFSTVKHIYISFWLSNLTFVIFFYWIYQSIFLSRNYKHGKDTSNPFHYMNESQIELQNASSIIENEYGYYREFCDTGKNYFDIEL